MNDDYIQSMLESKDFDFENENLASFDFSGRDLRCANFKNAILLGVDFTECNIEDAIV